jgi:hypothetical protein
VEQSNAFRTVNPDNNKRPDISILGLDRDFFGDVMVTDSIQKRTNVNNAGTPGHAAAMAETLKKRKYEKDSLAAGMLFLPIIFESYGRWGVSFHAFFNQLMKYGSAYRDMDVGEFTNYWRRRISVTLHKATAAAILSKIGKRQSSPNSDESNWTGNIQGQSYVRL